MMTAHTPDPEHRPRQQRHAIVCFANPTDTFAGLADVLGFLLLVFAGIWALMQGITNIVSGFELRTLHEEL